MASRTPHRTCPTCGGTKILTGFCECGSEWRGTARPDETDDCRCAPAVRCPTCRGTGLASKARS